MRRLCSLAGGRRRSYAERFPTLLEPLPGLHDDHQQSPTPRTEVTTLPNGVRIASQYIPGPMCCVGVTVAAGSVHETPSSEGAAHMLERLAFCESQNRGLGEIALSVEATGGKLGAAAGRERMFYRYGALRASLPLAVEVLLDCVRNPAFLRSQVRCKVAEAREELSFLESNPELFLRESLHRVGYSGTLGNPLFPTKETLARIDRGAIRNFYSTLMGGGASYSSGGPGKGMQSRLYLQVMIEHDWMQAISAFSTVYDDTGLFGIHLPAKGLDTATSVRSFELPSHSELIQPSDLVAEAVDIAIKELTAIARPGEVTEAELNRAKKSMVSSVLQNLEYRKSHTEDIGRQILIDSSGKASQHFLDGIDEVTLNDIMSVAQKMLSSCPTMASWGHGLH